MVAVYSKKISANHLLSDNDNDDDDYTNEDGEQTVFNEEEVCFHLLSGFVLLILFPTKKWKVYFEFESRTLVQVIGKMFSSYFS